jgi:hypothetical protein
VDLALICSFTRMRSYLNLGNVKADEVPEDTVKAVAETLKKSTSLKVSEDGEFWTHYTYVLYCLRIPLYTSYFSLFVRLPLYWSMREVENSEQSLVEFYAVDESGF